MDATEYKRLRQHLGLTNVDLAKKLGVSVRVAQRYEGTGGEQRIPKPIVRLLLMYLKHGIPKDW